MSNQNLYIQCSINRSLVYSDGTRGPVNSYLDVYTNEGKPLPVGQATKDYYQNLNTLAYDPESGSQYNLEGVYCEEYHKDDYHSSVVRMSDKKELYRCEQVGESELSIYIEPGVTYFVCHPDWRYQKVNIYYRYSEEEEYQKIVLESHTETRSRFIYAFLISTTKELFKYSDTSDHIVRNQE